MCLVLLRKGIAKQASCAPAALGRGRAVLSGVQKASHARAARSRVRALVVKGSICYLRRVAERTMAPEGSSVRLLVAGDKSSAGKSTVSLGLLAALLESGFSGSELAYIKPATQCVSSTLTARFCQSHGIAYEHIGPVVFYRGFTRDRLDHDLAAGESVAFAAEAEAEASTAVTDEPLTTRCARAVDRISRGKRLTLIDGVGYPSVGSIVGCSSADVAIACRAPVVIVGRPGVGDAVDSFNLCAAFFEARRVPVLGGIFNKLNPTGFYGLDKCNEYVSKYMAHYRPRQRVYGMLPKHETLAGAAAEETCGFAFKHPPQPDEAGPLTPEDEASIALVASLFKEHVDVKTLVDDLTEASAAPAKWVRELPSFPGTDDGEGEAADAAADGANGSKRPRK